MPFVAAHQADWARLETLVKRRRKLSGEEIDELVARYQRTATQLSVLRSGGHDPALTRAAVQPHRPGQGGGYRCAHPAWGDRWRSFFGVAFPAMAYRSRWWWLGTAAA